MRIREFMHVDQKQVIALWNECGLVVPWNDPAEDIERKLKVGRELFLVGMMEDHLMATVMGGYDGHRGWLYYLAVHPKYQGQGYGQKIIEGIEQRLMERGCIKINLQVRRKNEKVIGFYQSLGYVEDEVVSLGKRLPAEDD
ncbi:GNAT family acetyltransferase [Planctomycetota bacterium]|nr:GNAT family acetyltransferase [Planctomycetota bacterium]